MGGRALAGKNIRFDNFEEHLCVSNLKTSWFARLLFCFPNRFHYLKNAPEGSLNISKFGNHQQARRNEIHIGGAEISSERSEQKWGSVDLPPGKFFMITPFRSLENARCLENVLSTEAKDHD